MQRITILGSTGSIGVSTLDVVARHPDRYSIHALTAHTSVEELCRQCEQFKRLNHGLILDGKPLLPAKVKWQNEDQLSFILREGKKRQIRRMCDMVGLQVIGLKRVRIGNVKLGDLPTGEWRYLRPDEQF